MSTLCSFPALVLVTFAMLLFCQEMEGQSVSRSSANDIVNLHNKYRSTVRARNMQKLRWNSAAANAAQRWANTCPNGHDGNAARRIVGFSSCGQNISWMRGTSTSWPSAINQWYNEVRNFRYCARPTGEVGHYTQLMWAETSVIGCGIRTGCGNLGRGTTVYVCNYCNAGNIDTGRNRNSRYCPWKQ